MISPPQTGRPRRPLDRHRQASPPPVRKRMRVSHASAPPLTDLLARRLVYALSMTLTHTRPSQVSCTCEHCGVTFYKLPSEIKKGEGKYCSTRCYHTSQLEPRTERFWAKVNRLGPDDCWLWTGSRKGGKWGYGQLGSRDRRLAPESAHRVSWEIHHGSIPDGMKVLHRCDNPPCVNPNHLFLGTLRDNTQDMLIKRRHLEILLPAQIAELTERYRAGNISEQQLAKEYGVSQQTISRKLRQCR